MANKVASFVNAPGGLELITQALQAKGHYVAKDVISIEG